VKNVQFGCGKNKLIGWENYDKEIDISKHLPFSDCAVNNIFIEHCLEHVSQNDSLVFLDEAYRVLKYGGVIRVVVPSLEKVAEKMTTQYCDYIKNRGWSDGSREGTLRAMMTCHGHKGWWTYRLLELSLSVAGFQTERCTMYKSRHKMLRGIEGHAKIIGEDFAEIESIICEGIKI
jgi:predicted SAM-dependent methyltransferase